VIGRPQLREAAWSRALAGRGGARALIREPCYCKSVRYPAPMHRQVFANQTELIDYAQAHDLAYAWEGSSAFAKRWRLAQRAQAGQYVLVEVQTSRKLTKALLFPILRAEAEADRPFREAMAIKREQLAAKRAAKQAKDK
jgi:hypothetical protein